MLGLPYVVPPEKTFEFGTEIPLLGDHLTIGVFGILVVIGVLLGIQVAIRVYAKQKDLDEWMFRDEIFWVLVFGFIISHWISVIFYFPEKIEENPWVLLMLWNGLSSVGGFFGAFIGMNWFLRREKQPILVYADGNMFGLLLGMCFGRLACAWVHDHPGKVVEPGTFLAVGPWPGPQQLWRWDLGLLEFLVILALTLFIYFVWDWRKAAPGRLTGLVAFVYGPARFCFDFLRETEVSRGVSTPDLRYFGLTAAQYFSLAIFAAGVYLLVRKPKPSDYEWARDSERKQRAEAKRAEVSALSEARSEETEAQSD